MQHLENVIADTSRKCDCETVKGKSEKLVLEPAQNLSLIKQQNDLSIIDVADAVEKTKTKHLWLLKKFDKDCKKSLKSLENFIHCFSNILKNSKTH